jgi:putative tryptophan/tyrosine transport system substrate-binding protein
MRLIGLAVVLIVSLLAAPLTVEAQPAERVYRIGWLGAYPPEERAKVLARPGSVVNWNAFVQGLLEHGWIEKKNFVFEYRYSWGEVERYPRLAAELVALKPDVVATAAGDGAAHALKTATKTIPIVMVVSADPVGTGLVTSLGRPGGNVTGLSIQATDAGGKRLELLRAVLPKASRVAVLWNATYSSKAIEFRETQQAARSLKITLQSVELRSPRDFDGAFVAIAREKPDALITLSDGPLTLRHQREIVAFTTKHRLPMVSETAEFAEAGGLMTYGASLTALFRRAATYVDKILKGAKPADLPVEQPTKFELVINLKTAKALGLTIPPSVLGRADQVIQ